MKTRDKIFATMLLILIVVSVRLSIALHESEQEKETLEARYETISEDLLEHELLLQTANEKIQELDLVVEGYEAYMITFKEKLLGLNKRLEDNDLSEEKINP